ncbi:MAG: TolC family protein [Nitrospirota bacterium]
MFKRSLFRSFIAAICFFWIYSGFSAAETLEEAWKTALSADKRIIASRNYTEANRLNLSSALAVRLPSLSLESGYSILNNDPGALFHVPGSTPLEIHTAEDKSLSFSVSITVPLFSSGRITSGIDTAAAVLNTSVHDETKTSLDVKLDVAEAYVNVLRAKSLVAVAEGNVGSLESHAKDVANFYDQGVVTKNDLLASQVALADARQRLIQTLNTLDIAYASYNRLMDRSLDHRVTLEDLSAEHFNPDINEMTSKALQNRPELSSLDEQVRALQHQASGIRASSGPQIAVSSTYSYQQNKYQLYEDVWSATFGLTWNIFDGGISRYNSGHLLQKAEALKNLRANTASMISLWVRQACLEIDVTHRRIEVSRDAMKQSEENLRVVKDRYREGVGINTEVLDAESLRIKSYSNFYNAVYDAVLAALRLKYVTGNL